MPFDGNVKPRPEPSGLLNRIILIVDRSEVGAWEIQDRALVDVSFWLQHARKNGRAHAVGLVCLKISFQPIENYGVIGNMRSIALVGIDGSIDFLCYPNFDSPTVFAALLDGEKGGRFHLEPQLTNMRVRQLYLPDTNILLTRFLAEEGVAELTDYMPIGSIREQPNEIIRTVSVIRGNVHFTMRCEPRFDYARSAHRTEVSDQCAMFFPANNSCPPMALY